MIEDGSFVGIMMDELVSENEDDIGLFVDMIFVEIVDCS